MDERVYFGLGFQRVRMHYGGAHGSKCQAWWQEQEVGSVQSQEQVESR